MKTILIPTDFSSTARNALNYALRLFGTDNKFILLNSYEEPHTSTGSMISIREILRESSEEGLKEELKFIREELKYPHLDGEAISEYGDAPTSIQHVVKKHEVDLIVMGTTGASGIKEIMIGSVASDVMLKSSCPVFTVPDDYHYRPPQNILFATDLKDDLEDEHLELLASLASSSKGKVTLLTVNKDEKEMPMEDVEHGYDLHIQLEQVDHQFEVVYGKDVEDAIISYAKNNHMDLVVTIPRKSSWWQRIIEPSVSKKLAQHIEVPMLALPKKG